MTEQCCGNFCTVQKTSVRDRLLAYFKSIETDANVTRRVLNCANGKYFSNCGLNVDQLKVVHCILGTSEDVVAKMNREDLLRRMNQALLKLNQKVVYEFDGDLSADAYANRKVRKSLVSRAVDSAYDMYRRLVIGDDALVEEGDLMLRTPDEWETMAASDLDRGLTAKNDTLSKLAPVRWHLRDEDSVAEKVRFRDIQKYYRRSHWKRVWDQETDMLDEKKYAREASQALQRIKREIGDELYGYNFSKVFPVEPLSKLEFESLFEGLTFLHADQNLEQVYTWTAEFFEQLDRYNEEKLSNQLVKNTELLLVRPLTFHDRTYTNFQVYPGTRSIDQREDVLKNLVRHIRSQKVKGKKIFAKPSNILIKREVDGEKFSDGETSVASKARESARQKWRLKSKAMVLRQFVPLSDVYQSHGLDDPRFYTAQSKNLSRFTSLVLEKERVAELLDGIRVGDMCFLTQDILQRAHVFRELSSTKPVEVMPVQKAEVAVASGISQKSLRMEYYTLDGVGRVWALKRGLAAIGVDTRKVMLEVEVYQMGYKDWSKVLAATLAIRAIDGHVDASTQGLIPWKFEPARRTFMSVSENRRESALSEGVWRYTKNIEPDLVCATPCPPPTSWEFKKGDEYPWSRQCCDDGASQEGVYYAAWENMTNPPFGIDAVADKILKGLSTRTSKSERQSYVDSVLQKQMQKGKAMIPKAFDKLQQLFKPIRAVRAGLRSVAKSAAKRVVPQEDITFSMDPFASTSNLEMGEYDEYALPATTTTE